jgi:hypothetical protein
MSITLFKLIEYEIWFVKMGVFGRIFLWFWRSMDETFI